MRHHLEQLAASRTQANIILGVGAVLVAALILAAVWFQPPQPRLAAYGCNPDNGGKGVLYANEEDDFPASCVHVVAL